MLRKLQIMRSMLFKNKPKKRNPPKIVRINSLQGTFCTTVFLFLNMYIPRDSRPPLASQSRFPTGGCQTTYLQDVHEKMYSRNFRERFLNTRTMSFWYHGSLEMECVTIFSDTFHIQYVVYSWFCIPYKYIYNSLDW